MQNASWRIPVCASAPFSDGPSARLRTRRTSGTASGTAQKQVDAANEQYHEYVEDQSAELLAATKQFVATYKAGDDAEARRLYPTARVHWERIEPVAESFGDLDPRIDGREDVTDEGMRFTGYHRLEKDLWVTGLQADSDAVADQLLRDVEEVVAKAKAVTFNGLQLANGSKALLDEMALAAPGLTVLAATHRIDHIGAWATGVVRLERGRVVEDTSSAAPLPEGTTA